MTKAERFWHEQVAVASIMTGLVLTATVFAFASSAGPGAYGELEWTTKSMTAPATAAAAAPLISLDHGLDQTLKTGGDQITAARPMKKPRHSICTSDSSGHTEAQLLECVTRPAVGEGVRKIACVGDSITSGYGSTQAANTYPAQLQRMLDHQHPNKYMVTNLGHRGIAAAEVHGTGNKHAEGYTMVSVL